MTVTRNIKELHTSIKVIGFCGKARSGKDSAAMAVREHIIDYSDDVQFEAGYVVGIEAYAAPIKSMVAMLLDFFGKGQILQPETLQAYIEGDKREDVIPEIGVSTRSLMQTLGTEWGRNVVNKDIWLNSMISRLLSYKAMVEHGYKGAYVLITDVRFENEAQSLKDMGAVVVRMDRNVDEVGEKGHASEVGVPDSLIDHVVFNDNLSLDELGKEVVSVLSNHLPWSSEQRFPNESKEKEGDDADEAQSTDNT